MGQANVGDSHRFSIRDPKHRVIHAPCFRERVLHHAIIAHVGPVLEKSMIDDSFACRKGKGSLAAVHRCQQHIRKYRWYSKQDIRQYFASIAHTKLKDLLERRFRDAGLLSLLFKIIDSFEMTPGHGLPIGALTSQWFANTYLAVMDRFLLRDPRVKGIIRYMDDFVIWSNSNSSVKSITKAVLEFLAQELSLELNSSGQINRSDHGINICGYRVFAGTIRLAQSRRQRCRMAIKRWEKRWLRGEITADELQKGISASLAIAKHSECQKWLQTFEFDSQTWSEFV